MTKVEELRGKIIDMAQGVSFADIGMFLHLLDEYYAEGVEEGTARERETIREKGVFVAENESVYDTEAFDASGCTGWDNKTIIEIDDWLAKEDYYILPASVLAPPKERE